MIFNPVIYAPKPSFPANFADATWEQIIEACQNNAVPDTWVAYGSCYKDMLINGTNYRIDIIGKNHDTYASGGTAPLTFQMHDCYDTTYQMLSRATNAGWINSNMRTTHLPAILALMPAEVQAAIREIQKTTIDVVQETIQSTNDKLFLLSEIEIFGSATYSSPGEGTQYAYYQTGNSRVKNKNGSANIWWERSPILGSTGVFCCVNADGSSSGDDGIYSYGVAFAFCF